MARASVELIVEAAKAVNPLRKVEQQSKKVDQALKKSQRAARDVEAAFQRMGRNGIRSLRDLETNAARLGRRMGGLRGAVGKAAIAFAAFKSVQTGIQRIESERRIKLLGQRFGEVAGLQNAAAQAAEKFKLSQTEANQALGNAFARLRPLGVSLDDITSTFNGFRTAAVLGGATAAEASASFTQLSQALGSGALRGDEFRSIAEQAPLVLQAISDETGVAAGELKDYAKEGLLTSDIVIKALKRIESEGAARLQEALDGPAAKIKEFQNATEDVQVALTESVIPELSKSFVILAGIINDLKPVIQSVGNFAATVLGGIAGAIERIRDPNKLASEVRTSQARNLMAKGISLRRLTGSGMSNLGPDYAAQEAALFAAAAKPTEQPKGTSPLTIPPGKDQNRTAKERVDMSQKLFDLNKQLFDSDTQLTELQRLGLEFQIEKQEILEQNLGPLEQEIRLLEAADGFEQNLLGYRKEQLKLQGDAAKKAEEQRKKLEEAERKRLEADPGFKMKQQLEELLDVQNQVAAGATAIGNAFSNSLKAVVTGSKSAEQALADMMASVAEHFLDMAAQIIAQQIAMIIYGTIMKALGVTMGGGGGGGGGGAPTPPVTMPDAVALTAAEGAYVSGPTNALVGEGGEPEYIIPESKMRESMARYSRGARGGSVIPESGEGGTTGEGGGAAVAAPIDVRFNVERINNVDYVTAEQFQVGLQQAAQQGAAEGERRAMGSLRNSAAVRRRIGV